ncbi:MAG TPA: acyl-CoA dehydrogenase family protein [Candidatus Aveggerthella excrementigallinarum]|nr:acyl-CoA dehydrogenase family protein [Candidatus Aveggerthella excrementigallinarum]
MDFSLTDEQQLMLENLREFCDRWVTEEKIQKWYEDRRVEPEVCKAYLDAGFGYMFLPEEYGGIPGDAVTLALVVEELMRCTGATMPFMSYGLAMYDLAEFGNEEQVKAGMEVYQQTGEQCFSLALSEPCAGSDNQSMISTVHWNDDGTVTLNGTKTMVSHAETAPWIMFIGKDEDPSHDNRSMSMFLVPKDTPGITMAPLHKIGQTITNFDEVYFDNVVVSQDTLLGEKGNGFKQLMRNFELERIMLSAHSLGLAQAALEDATRYAAQRETFQQKLYKHQIIQQKLTDMEIKVQNMRNMLYRTAWEFDQGMSVRLDSALMKRYLSTTCTEVASDALQIFGGIGYTTESRIGRIWIDCRGDSFAGGTEEIMVHIAGRQIIKKYASDLL